MATTSDVIDLTQSDDEKDIDDDQDIPHQDIVIIDLTGDDDDYADFQRATAPSPPAQRRAQFGQGLHRRGLHAADALVDDTSGDAELRMFPDGSFLGSRLGGFGGAGVAYKLNNIWHGRAVALGPARNNTDAEMRAIVEALQMAASISEAHMVEKVIIQTDCESCIMAMARAREQGGTARWRDSCHLSDAIHSETVLRSKGIRVQIWWVKGHSDSVGNDVADKLARLGAERSRDNPESWGMTWDDPPSGSLDRANQLGGVERDPRKHMRMPKKKVKVKAPARRKEMKMDMRRRRRMLARSVG